MQLELLLQRIKDIDSKYEQFAKLTGEKFNVFSVLGLDNKENYHSLFIAELLNPQGNHGQQDLYLKLFLETANLVKDYNSTKKAKITTEKSIGEVDHDYNQGGRIDILIEIADKQIIIENKIYAGDQCKQLHRYSQKYPNAEIVYLTLDNSKPTDYSLGDLSQDDVICISYQEHILNWIIACIEKSAALPNIRETLIQYRDLIKKLTNQCSSKDKEMEIQNVILDSEENFNAAKQVQEVVSNINKINDIVLNLMRNKFKEKHGSHFFKLCSIDEYSVNMQVVYDNYDKFFQIGITPLKNNEWPHTAKFDWKKSKSLLKISDAAHKYVNEKYATEKYKKIKGYFTGYNYICCIPFGAGEDGQSYLFSKPDMTFADYKWLSYPENQDKLIQYSLKLCDEIITFLYNELKSNPEIEFNPEIVHKLNLK